MKLTIFGATGRTGQPLLEQALQANHEVTVLVRKPEKLTSASDQLKIIQGDIADANKVGEAVAGCEGVISVLGPTSNEPVFAVSQGIKNIINTMDEHGVKRLIISAGAGVEDPNDEPKLINKLISFALRTFNGNVYEDMVRTVDAVRNSDLDWTIVRVPMLTDDPAKGNVKVAYVGKGMGSRITRADMAAFMLEQLDDEAYLHKAPAISN
ncbi:MAG: SDR family oxidoreductase [Candidatus Promineifilaceae bacterium]|nr:SDR family oxidoreductase [Candidatus Promineifilaceae bacterium]